MEGTGTRFNNLDSTLREFLWQQKQRHQRHGGAKPADTDEIIRPACMRIRAKYPKGFVTIKGAFKNEQYG